MPDKSTPDVARSTTRQRPPASVSLSPITGRARAARGIVESLRGDIAAGLLPLGSRLPSERELARHFGVSQPTVREAVRALDLMGLVNVRHGSGVYVTGDVSNFLATSLRILLQVERVGITDVLDLRALLGGYSARLAAEHVTEDEVAQMGDYLHVCEFPTAETTFHDTLAAVVSFQLAVSAAARNPLLFAIESFLIKLISQFQVTALEHHGQEFWTSRVQSFAPDRRRLLDCIVDHDAPGAVDAMALYLKTQSARFTADPELLSVTVTNPADFVSQLDDILPDLKPRRRL
jgi:GntR family transcriptional regulator, transcriptional repressor for pyruvate dehydrogenase complex